MIEEPKPVKRRPVLLLVAIAFFGIAALTGLVIFQMNSKMVDYNYTLYFSAKALNIGCPKMVAENVRLDSVAAKPGLQLWYYYSMTNAVKDDDATNIFCEAYEDSIVESLSTSTDMTEFGKNNVTLVFHIKDKDGAEMCSIPVPPGKYYSAPSN